MKLLRCEIKPLSPFATPLMGDTLFGQLCWEIANTMGQEKLIYCLDGYHDDRPFLVVSDAFPKGSLPRPVLPSKFERIEIEDNEDNIERKKLKKIQWIKTVAIDKPINDWCRSLKDPESISVKESGIQYRNSINRLTGTTGDNDEGDSFAPYSVDIDWFNKEMHLHLYFLIEEEKITSKQLEQLVHALGLSGYGKDAKVGMGKFEIKEWAEHHWQQNKTANAYLTLANSAPEKGFYQAECSYYKTFVRFGKHGDRDLQNGQPFKSPIIFAKAGACLVPKEFRNRQFIGQGLGGDGSLSNSRKETVHQGYAPVVAVEFDTTIKVKE